jgi:hypothetical protein
MFSGNMSSENAPGEDGGGEKRVCPQDVVVLRTNWTLFVSGKWLRKVAPEGIISDG